MSTFIGFVASVELKNFCVIIFHKINKIYMIIHNNLISERYKGFVYPLAIILLNVYSKCRFTLSFREIEEMTTNQPLINLLAWPHNAWGTRFCSVLEYLLTDVTKPKNLM